MKVLINGEQAAGTHDTSSNGSDNYGNSAASGVYFLRIYACSYINTIKMMLLK